MAARMRTIKQTWAHIHVQDPGSSISIHYLRHLVKSGEFRGFVFAGKKILIAIDELDAYLSNPQRTESAPQVGIRRVNE